MSKERVGARPLWVTGLWSAVAAVAVTLVLLLGLSALISAEYIPSSLYEEYVIGAIFLAVTVVAAVTTGRVGREGLITGLIIGGIYFIILFLAALTRAGSTFELARVVKLGIGAVSGGAFGGVLGTGHKSQKHRPRRRSYTKSNRKRQLT